MIHVIKQNHPLYPHLKALRSATVLITATTATTAHRSRTCQAQLSAHDIPPGSYKVVKAATGTMTLTTIPDLDHGVSVLIPGPDWETSTMRLDTSLTSIVDRIAQLTEVLYPAKPLLYPLLSQRGGDVTICYKPGSEHIILMAPGMTLALTPTIKRFITGIPLALDQAIRAHATARNTSINKVVLDALGQYAASHDN